MLCVWGGEGYTPLENFFFRLYFHKYYYLYDNLCSTKSLFYSSNISISYILFHMEINKDSNVLLHLFGKLENIDNIGVARNFKIYCLTVSLGSRNRHNCKNANSEFKSCFQYCST